MPSLRVIRKIAEYMSYDPCSVLLFELQYPLIECLFFSASPPRFVAENEDPVQYVTCSSLLSLKSTNFENFWTVSQYVVICPLLLGFQ